MSNDSKSHYLAASSEESIQVKKLKERLESLYPSAVIHYTAKWDSESDCPVGFEEFIRKLVQRLIRNQITRMSSYFTENMAAVQACMHLQ